MVGEGWYYGAPQVLGEVGKGKQNPAGLVASQSASVEKRNGSSFNENNIGNT